MKRYFIFSASFNTGDDSTITQIFGTVQDLFPTQSILKDVVRSFRKFVFNITIVSISEVSEEDFKRFWEE